MVGGVFSMLARLGGGSLRKKLYVRLAAAAVLLASSVWGIAQLQRATLNSKEKEKKAVAAKNKSDETAAKPKSSETDRRRPQPVPGPDSSEIPAPDSQFDPTYAQVGDTRFGDNTDTTDVASAYSSKYLSNNNRRNDSNRYSLDDENEDDTNAESIGDSQSSASVAADDQDDDSDEPQYVVDDEVLPSTATTDDANGENTADSSTSSGNLLRNLISGTEPDDAHSSAGPSDETLDDAVAADDADADINALPDPDEIVADETAEVEAPAPLMIHTNESEAAASDLDSSAAGEGLTQLNSERAQFQPMRTLNVDNTAQSLSTADGEDVPPLLPTGPQESPLDSSAGVTTPAIQPNIALPPSRGLDGTTAAELEGAQVPSLFLEKTAPDEVQVGRPARFEIFVRNVGKARANHVVVTDRIPEGAELVETTPEAQVQNGMLVWNLGTMEPGDEAQLSLTVTPQVEGYIGSVAQVSFAALAAARTISTKPVLKLFVEAPEQVLIGNLVNLAITVRNEGTGPARGVVIEDDVPEGLTHPAGRELEHELGTLRPNEERRLTLALTAENPGVVTNVVRIHDDGDLELTQSTTVDVVAPQLAIGIDGPKLRYLERQATYSLSITNSGTAAANNVEITARLPANLRFVSADKLGQYDARQHAVYWNLEELPQQKTGEVRLVTLPVDEGTRELLVEAHADLASAEPTKHEVTVESVSELAFSISDASDPIEVGSDTIYEIAVSNQGSKTDRDIVVALLFPDELQPVKGEGPTEAIVSGQQVQFKALGQLAAGANVIYRVQAQGSIAGDARILVQLTSEQMPKPVSKEESTKVYTD